MCYIYCNEALFVVQNVQKISVKEKALEAGRMRADSLRKERKEETYVNTT